MKIVTRVLLSFIRKLSFMKKKVTGIGGIFFKSKDPDKIKNWYRDHLGMEVDKYGSLFRFREYEEPTRPGHLQWSVFTDDSSYMEPSQKDFMINYRVENLTELMEELKAAGIEALDKIEEYEYGKFVHILDPDGNKIELWEPIDEPFLPDDQDSN